MDSATIELAKSNYGHGESIRGKAKVRLASRFAGTVELFWEDSHGRIIERVEKRARFPSLQRLSFEFKLDKFPVAVVNKIVLQVTDDLLVRRSRTEARFTITPPRFVWDDYEIILWGSKQEWATEHYMEQLKQCGVTGAMAYAVKPGRPRRDANWLADGDLRFYVENVCQIGWDGKIARQLREDFISKAYKNGCHLPPDKKYLVRKPCMNDPAYWAEARQRIQDEVRARDDYMPMAYNIGDEQSISFFTTPYDFCFSEHCLKKFRTWLRERYGTVAKLNESWDTFFKSWRDVQPLTREEVRARAGRSHAPWADHRDFMDTQIVELVRRFIGYFHEVAPGAHVGIEGTQKPAVYGGFDYWKLMNIPLSFHEIYDIGGSHRIMGSFNKNRCPVLSLIGCGRDNREQMWQRFFHGDRGAVIWWMPAFTAPDGTVREPVRAQKETWNEFTGGIAKLLDLDQSVHDGVAIHYSPASGRAEWIAMPEIPMSGDHEITNTWDLERLGVMRLVEDLGTTYRFISYEQVEKGGLAGYKVLFLPASVALSDLEARRIREFVRKGGLLIADYKAGWMDEHCKRREGAALDDVFGVTRESFETEPFETTSYKHQNGYWFEEPPPLADHEVLLDKDTEGLTVQSGRLYYPTVESTLRPTTGAALGHEGDVPAFVVHRFGKGIAVYLNFRLLYYADHRAHEKRQVWAQMTLGPMKQLFDLAGLRPAAELGLGRRTIGVERVTFRDGAATYHGLRRNLGGKQRGLGEVEGGLADATKPVGVSLQLAQPGHVYELRSGKYLGATDFVSGTLQHPDPLIYAVLPYRIDALDLDAKPAYPRGSRATVRIGLSTREKVKFVNHVLRCRLYGPDTLERTAARKNLVTKTGKATYAFDLALNDMAGAWRVVVRDIATGIESEHKFTVAGPPE